MKLGSKYFMTLSKGLDELGIEYERKEVSTAIMIASSLSNANPTVESERAIDGLRIYFLQRYSKYFETKDINHSKTLSDLSQLGTSLLNESFDEIEEFNETYNNVIDNVYQEDNCVIALLLYYDFIARLEQHYYWKNKKHPS